MYQSVNLGLASVFDESELPIRSCKAEGGFSMTIDISKCREFIPSVYFTNDYIDDENVPKTTFDGEVPLDFAF